MMNSSRSVAFQRNERLKSQRGRAMLYHNSYLFNVKSVKLMQNNDDDDIERFRLYHYCRTPNCKAGAQSIREGSANTGRDLDIILNGEEHLNNSEGSLVPSNNNYCICSANSCLKNV